jgi:hypothetical protein
MKESPTHQNLESPPFIVELRTQDGRVTERFDTYEEAVRRIEQFPTETLLGLPMIFQQLPDGSERVVRDDGKPLQFHRVYAEDLPDAEEMPLSLADGESGLLGPDGALKLVERQGEEWAEEIPLLEIDELRRPSE